MLNWNIINLEGISVRCADESETALFLQECEKKNIKWKSGLPATAASMCYREICTNGGQYLEENHENFMINFNCLTILSSNQLLGAGLIKEFNGESCSWCKNEENCKYNRRHMEYTREAIKNVLYCTKAYCSAKVTCDYYIEYKDKYRKYNIGECSGG